MSGTAHKLHAFKQTNTGTTVNRADRNRNASYVIETLAISQIILDTTNNKLLLLCSRTELSQTMKQTILNLIFPLTAKFNNILYVWGQITGLFVYDEIPTGVLWKCYKALLFSPLCEMTPRPSRLYEIHRSACKIVYGGRVVCMSFKNKIIYHWDSLFTKMLAS